MMEVMKMVIQSRPSAHLGRGERRSVRAEAYCSTNGSRCRRRVLLDWLKHPLKRVTVETHQIRLASAHHAQLVHVVRAAASMPAGRPLLLLILQEAVASVRHDRVVHRLGTHQIATMRMMRWMLQLTRMHRRSLERQACRLVVMATVVVHHDVALN